VEPCLELCGVALVVAGVDPVALPVGDDPAAEQPLEIGHVRTDHMPGRGRGVVTPDLVDEAVDTDLPWFGRQQDRQHAPLFGTAELDGCTVLDDS
jgi:hypothetical protein